MKMVAEDMDPLMIFYSNPQPFPRSRLLSSPLPRRTPINLGVMDVPGQDR